MKRRLAGLTLMAMLAACGNPAKPEVPPQATTNAEPAPGPALDLLRAGIGDRRFVLLGEMHGTQEIPALVGDLVGRYVQEGEPVILALEITERDQHLVDRYLVSPGGRSDRAALLAGEHWQEPTHDGRDSQAMLGLIEHVRRLRAQGHEVSIVLFDGDGGQQRNQAMADRLRAVVRSQPRALVLALTGNVHAMTSAPPWKMFDNGKQIEPPMTTGRYLSDLDPLSIDISAAQGEYWACAEDGCGIQAMPRHGSQSSATYEASDVSKSPWNATLTLPAFSASPPAAAPG